MVGLLQGFDFKMSRKKRNSKKRRERNKKRKEEKKENWAEGLPKSKNPTFWTRGLKIEMSFSSLEIPLENNLEKPEENLKERADFLDIIHKEFDA